MKYCPRRDPQKVSQNPNTHKVVVSSVVKSRLTASQTSSAPPFDTHTSISEITRGNRPLHTASPLPPAHAASPDTSPRRRIEPAPSFIVLQRLNRLPPPRQGSKKKRGAIVPCLSCRDRPVGRPVGRAAGLDLALPPCLSLSVT